MVGVFRRWQQLVVLMITPRQMHQLLVYFMSNHIKHPQVHVKGLRLILRTMLAVESRECFLPLAQVNRADITRDMNLRTAKVTVVQEVGIYNTIMIVYYGQWYDFHHHATYLMYNIFA